MGKGNLDNSQILSRRRRFDEESFLFSLPGILMSSCLFVKTALDGKMFLSHLIRFIVENADM